MIIFLHCFTLFGRCDLGKKLLFSGRWVGSRKAWQPKG
ncbi:hypothetical protein CsSME_00034048 [Camellia sinensis var. sinensis]